MKYAALNSKPFQVSDANVAELADIFQEVVDGLRQLAREEPLAKVKTRLVNEKNEVTPKNEDKKLAFLRCTAISRD